MIRDSFEKLRFYCEQRNFTGWDPYDGLNSQLLRGLQLHRSKFFRIAIIQFNKKSPINLRRLLLVPDGENPKGIALFLSGYCNLYRYEPKVEYVEKIQYLSSRLIALASRGYSGYCWGYNFDWQSRAFFLPKYTPTVVATSFAAYALMDAYDILKDEKLLNCAISSKKFVINDLNRTFLNGRLFFSYSPLDKSVVYNASLLGCRLLARIYAYTGEKELIRLAREGVAACVEKQNDDGSWYYGEMNIQKWIDSFHTGYNLESIYEYMKYANDSSFQTSFDKGMRFYKEHFFTNEGIPKYYHDRIYPIDPHSLAQYIRTIYVSQQLNEEKEKIRLSLLWIIKNMQSSRGYFYFNKKKYYTIRIPYMRWVQAWMFYAMSHCLIELEDESGSDR